MFSFSNLLIISNKQKKYLTLSSFFKKFSGNSILLFDKAKINGTNLTNAIIELIFAKNK